MSDRSNPAPDASPADAGRIVPIVAEQAFVLMRTIPTEGVRVRTVVRQDDAMIDQPVATETVEVERVPLDRWVDGPVPVRHEGDTTIVTLLEEVVVVERRLRATEEVRITKRRIVETASHPVTLRREDVVIERITPVVGRQQNPD